MRFPVLVILFIAAIGASGVAIEQPPVQAISVTPTQALLGLASIIGALMLFSRFADRQIDGRLLAVDSPLTRHNENTNAHEEMRKRFRQDFDAQIALIHERIDQYKKEDGERMQQFRSEVIEPLLALNRSQREIAAETVKHLADAIRASPLIPIK